MDLESDSFRVTEQQCCQLLQGGSTVQRFLRYVSVCQFLVRERVPNGYERSCFSCGSCCYHLFDSLKLYRFSTNSMETVHILVRLFCIKLLCRISHLGPPSTIAGIFLKVQSASEQYGICGDL